MENKCEKCGELAKSNFNFCPNCGEALTEIAKNIKKEDRRGAMLETVIALSDKITDPKDLKILNELLKKLKP